MRVRATIDELVQGEDVTVWRHDGTGQGGILLHHPGDHPDGCVRLRGPDGQTHAIPLCDVSFYDVDRPAPAEDCRDYYRGGCKGSVEMRWTGERDRPLCEAHGERALRLHEEIQERYPRHAPADFDPLYAGERWD